MVAGTDLRHSLPRGRYPTDQIPFGGVALWRRISLRIHHTADDCGRPATPVRSPIPTPGQSAAVWSVVS